MKIIHISDTHFVKPGQTLYGKSPKAHLEKALEQINRLHADAEMVVITGDLAHLGEKEAYLELHSVLAKLHIPWNLLIGNHDNREALADCFPSLPINKEGFHQYTVKTSAGVFIMLDTKQKNTHGGFLCSDRLSWLADQLKIYRDIPAYIFMHHVPFQTQLSCMDDIGLENSDSLADVLSKHLSVRHIFCGHAHRPMAGSWFGIPFSCLRSMNHQVVLDFQSSHKDIPLSFEQPQYCVCFIHPDSVVVHFHDFLDVKTNFMMDDYRSTVDK